MLGGALVTAGLEFVAVASWGWDIVLGYLFAVTTTTFALYGYDKAAARKKNALRRPRDRTPRLHVCRRNCRRARGAAGFPA